MSSYQSDSTMALFACARAGDSTARDQLAARYVTPLRNWARKRLAGAPCDMLDTEDLVLTALFQGVSRLRQIDVKEGAAFLAYLQRILLNQFRDQARRIKRHPTEALGHDLSSRDISPLEELVRRERIGIYRRGLAGLTHAQRAAVILRFEHELPYAEIAATMRLSSADAARGLAARGVTRLKKLARGYFDD